MGNDPSRRKLQGYTSEGTGLPSEPAKRLRPPVPLFEDSKEEPRERLYEGPVVIDGSRRGVQRGIFATLDRNGDGRLDCEEMFTFAKLIGFEDDRDAWQIEFQSLCDVSATSGDGGIN